MQTNDIKTVGYGIDPNITINGRAVGLWKRTMQGKRAIVQLQPFSSLTPGQLHAIEKAVTLLVAFTGIPAEISRDGKWPPSRNSDQ